MKMRWMPSAGFWWFWRIAKTVLQDSNGGKHYEWNEKWNTKWKLVAECIRGCKAFFAFFLAKWMACSGDVDFYTSFSCLSLCNQGICSRIKKQPHYRSEIGWWGCSFTPWFPDRSWRWSGYRRSCRRWHIRQAVIHLYEEDSKKKKWIDKKR